MSLLPEFIPAAFPLLALSHFVALVSPGPDFFLLAGYAIRYRLRGSAGIGPGIALGNAFILCWRCVAGGCYRITDCCFV
jgi:threonine/homoserine/homoserine lactone efflux protein